MGFELIEVGGKRALRAFLSLPYYLYREDPVWVAPLRSVAFQEFDKKRNRFFRDAEVALFLVKSGKEILGRIAAFVNHAHLRYYDALDEKIGYFGYFEAVGDRDVSHLLYQASTGWLKDKKMTHIRGPLTFSPDNIGFLARGFDYPQTILSPYNPPYYNDMAMDFGLEKAMDLNVYFRESVGYELPGRFVERYDYLKGRYNIRVREMDRKNLMRDIGKLVEVINLSQEGNWGFVPHDESDIYRIRGMAKKFRMMGDSALLLFMESGDETVGYAVAIPDVNRILEGSGGRLTPMGMLRLKTGIKKIKEYRFMGLGLTPKFQGRGLDTIFYYDIFRRLSRRGARVEVNFVLETNRKMNNALLKLGFEPTKKFRVYEMGL